MTTERKFLRRSLFLPIVAATASTLLVATISLQPFTNVLPLLPMMLPWILFITTYATFLVGSAEALLEQERQRSMLLRIVEKKMAQSSVAQTPQPLVVGTFLPPRTPRQNGRSLQFRVQIRSKKTGISVFSSSLGLMKLGCLPTQPTGILASLPSAVAPDGPPPGSELRLANDNPWALLQRDAIPSDDTLPPSLNTALNTVDTSLRLTKNGSESPLDASPLSSCISDPDVHGFAKLPPVDLSDDQEQMDSEARTVQALDLGGSGILSPAIPEPPPTTFSHDKAEAPSSPCCGPVQTEEDDPHCLQELPFFDFENNLDETEATLDGMLSVSPSKSTPPPGRIESATPVEVTSQIPHDTLLSSEFFQSPVSSSPVSVTMSMSDLLNHPEPLHHASFSVSLSSEWSGVLHLLPDYFPTWEALKRDGHLLTLSLFQMRVPEGRSGPEEPLSELSGDRCEPMVPEFVAAKVVGEGGTGEIAVNVISL